MYEREIKPNRAMNHWMQMRVCRGAMTEKDRPRGAEWIRKDRRWRIDLIHRGLINSHISTATHSDKFLKKSLINFLNKNLLFL